MLRVCWKHREITQGLLGCRYCRAERFREIADSTAAETAEKIKEIFARHAPRRRKRAAGDDRHPRSPQGRGAT